MRKGGPVRHRVVTHAGQLSTDGARLPLNLNGYLVLAFADGKASTDLFSFGKG